MAVYYRNFQKMFVSCGILFNHESPPLNEDRKPIVQNGKLLLGTLETIRDWGFAGDFVVATGTKHTVRDFCEAAFSYFYPPQ